MGELFSPFKIAKDLVESAGETASAAGKVLNEAAIAAAEGASAAAKTAGDVLSQGAATVSDAAGCALHDLQMRKYNPLFPDQYLDPEFDRPKVVVIVDEDERKGVAVCEGAIGWLSLDRKPEVMHLYEEAIERTGLKFHPRPVCDAAYLRDPFDNERYIEVCKYLSVSKADQITELKQIARDLGAKECRLASYEDEAVTRKAKAGKTTKAWAPLPDAPAVKAASGGEENLEVGTRTSTSSQILFTEKFQGDAKPRRPKLKWFKNDEEMLSLIEARCSDEPKNVMTEYNLDVSSTSTMVMSQSYAKKIDASLGAAGMKMTFSLSAEYEKECKKRLVYTIVF